MTLKMLALMPYAVPRLKQIELLEEIHESEVEILRQEIANGFDRMFSLPEGE